MSSVSALLFLHPEILHPFLNIIFIASLFFKSVQRIKNHWSGRCFLIGFGRSDPRKPPTCTVLLIGSLPNTCFSFSSFLPLYTLFLLLLLLRISLVGSSNCVRDCNTVLLIHWLGFLLYFREGTFRMFKKEDSFYY